MEKIIYVKVMIMAVLMVCPLIKEKTFKLYHPAILMSMIFFLQFGIPTLFMVANPTEFLQFDFFSLDALSSALTFIILTYVFFLVGFYLPVYNKDLNKYIANLCRKIPSTNNYTFEIKNIPLVLMVLWSIGWISRVLLIKMGGYYHTEVGYNQVEQVVGFQRIAQYINIGSLFPLIALSLCFLEWLKNPSKKQYFLLVSGLLLVLEIIYGLPSGSKERILFPVAIILFLYSLRYKFPIFLGSVSIILFVFVVFPYVGIYRSIPLSGNALEDAKVTFEIYKNLFSYFDVTVFQAIMNQIFAERFNSSIILTSIVEDTPDIWNFKLGYTYVLVLISFIPRLIWPNKPAINGFNNDFGRDYGFIDFDDYTTSVGMTWIGEMFINFGWFGIVIGVLYGILYQIIYSYFFRTGKMTAVSAIIYSLVLYYMVRGETMFAAQFSGMLKICLVIFIVMYPFLKRVNTTK